jgi:hypothetical protein
MMKKIVAGLMVALGCMSAQAMVPCIVNPTSPVYHVDTYIRMQTSCVTTQHAGGAGMGASTAAKVLGVAALIILVENITTDIALEVREQIIKDNHKVVKCDGKIGRVDVVVGKDYAIVRQGSRVEKHSMSEPGVYFRMALFPSTLDINTLEYKVFGKVYGTCELIQNVIYVKE